VIPIQALTRHTLITGFTGSGKTNTVLFLLDQLWRKNHIPFMVIESAKKEYRALARMPGFEDMLVFTLGDETVSPFRLNPFELLPGIRL
jgi:type IV secretory pathway VirB4 component